MTWTLDIHTIDVGAGESSFIIVQNTANAAWTRTMLIDAGLAGYAQTVHDKIVAVNPAQDRPVDFIVVTHYDVDHSAGIADLLQADNLSAFTKAIADVAAPFADPATFPADTRPERIARVAAAVTAAAAGATAASAGPLATAAATAAAGLADDNAAREGIAQAESTRFLLPSLVPISKWRAKAAKLASLSRRGQRHARRHGRRAGG